MKVVGPQTKFHSTLFGEVWTDVGPHPLYPHKYTRWRITFSLSSTRILTKGVLADQNNLFTSFQPPVCGLQQVLDEWKNDMWTCYIYTYHTELITETTKYFNKIQNNGNSEYREHFYWDSTSRFKLKTSSGMHSWWWLQLESKRRISIKMFTIFGVTIILYYTELSNR